MKQREKKSSEQDKKETRQENNYTRRKQGINAAWKKTRREGANKTRRQKH